MHLYAASDWESLSSLLLNFDFWERVFDLGGMEFALVSDIAAAQAAAASAGVASGAKHARDVAADALRWLQSEGRFMRQDPTVVLQRACASPSCSEVHKATRAYHRQAEILLMNPPVTWPALRMTVECGKEVKSVCCSLDGKHVFVAAGRDAQIREVATGRLLATLEGHTGDITCCAVWPYPNAKDVSAKDGSTGQPLIATSSEVRLTKCITRNISMS